MKIYSASIDEQEIDRQGLKNAIKLLLDRLAKSVDGATGYKINSMKLRVNVLEVVKLRTRLLLVFNLKELIL